MMECYDTIFYILYKSEELYYEKIYNSNEDKDVLGNSITTYLKITCLGFFNIVPIMIFMKKYLSVDFKLLMASDVLYWTAFFALTFGLNGLLLFRKKRYLKIIEKYDSYPREAMKSKRWYLVIWIIIIVILLTISMCIV